MNAKTDRAWCEFLDVLTGRIPADYQLPNETFHEFKVRIGERQPLPDDNEFDDDENWRDGTMRDGMRRARRRP